VKLPLTGLAPSVALQLTVVVPSGKVLPEAGTHVTATLPAQASVAVAVKVTPTAPAASLRYTVWLPGKLRTGSAVSVTVNVATLLVTAPPLLLTATV
jgi:hypothetical protein